MERIWLLGEAPSFLTVCSQLRISYLTSSQTHSAQQRVEIPFASLGATICHFDHLAYIESLFSDVDPKKNSKL